MLWALLRGSVTAILWLAIAAIELIGAATALLLHLLAWTVGSVESLLTR